MKKEYIGYTIIGIVAGLVMGFIVANWTTAAGGGQAAANRQPQGSVNSSSQNQELPPDHPPIPGGPQSEPPLPANHPPIQGAQPVPAPPLTGSGQAAGSATSMPSLDPLPAASREKRAEQEYKNIQLLKGVPADRVQAIMEHFKSALGVDCTYCHVENQFEKDSKPMKKVARDMITLTRNNNRAMGGAGQVTCFTCHRGQPVPPKS
jgi:hypothetical protein